MRFNFIGGAIHDVHPATVGPPSGNARRKMLIGIGDAAVVLFFIFVLFGVGRRIAAEPELLDELVALFVVGEFGEGGALFITDDVAHVFIKPFLVGFAELLLQCLLVGAALLFRD